MRIAGKFIRLTGLKDEKIVIEPLDIVAMVEHEINGNTVNEIHTRHGIRVNVEQSIESIIDLVEEWRLDETAESIAEWASKSHIRELMRHEKEKAKARFKTKEKEDVEELVDQIIETCKSEKEDTEDK